eukprot:scaffold15497_cov117-Cylindrotheca_fusiformis.AAC.14
MEAQRSRIRPGMWITLVVLVLLSLFFDWKITNKVAKGKWDVQENKKNSPVERIPNHTSSADKSPVAKNASSVPKREGRNPVISVIVQLNGEMGNHVFKMANGLCLKHLIEENLGLGAEFILRAQEDPKWESAMLSTKAAFPKTRPFDFRKGNTEEFAHAHKQQLEWLNRLKSKKKLNLTNITYPLILSKQEKCEEKRCYLDLLRLLNQTWYMDPPRNQVGTNISIPHVYADTMATAYCWDLMYDELKAFFEVDTKSICKKSPEPDETVYHFRNFLTEFTSAKEKGFEEMDPNMTANYLFADFTSGEKVAIVSRYHQHTGDYIRALKDIKGIEARYIENQTGAEDFCFLLNAKREVIGDKRSTFVTLAAYLGDVKRARLYSFDTPERRKRQGHYFAYSFENQKLRDRIVFENYNAFGKIDKLR